MPARVDSLAATSDEPDRPLVVTTDLSLLDELVRLAAAGGVRTRVAADVPAARAWWDAAGLVLVGADVAQACARAGLAKRPGVIVVAAGGHSSPPWPGAHLILAEHVAVLPEAQDWLVDRFADYSHGGRAGRGQVIAVLGGSGGAGASVLAVGLAVTGRLLGRDTLLVDADPYGGGVDLVLGWERRPGLRWPDLVGARGRVNPPALVAALPRVGSLAVLSFDRSELAAVPVEAMAATLDAGRRGRDLVVVDLPRSLDETSRYALSSAERALLVVPAEIRACAAARRVAQAVAANCHDLTLIVRRPRQGAIAAEEIAQALELPLGGVIPSDAGLSRALARGVSPAGTGRGALAQLCRRLLAQPRPAGPQGPAR